MRTIKLKKGAVGLAPMANITTKPFTDQAIEFGADFVWSPMIFSEALVHNKKDSLAILNLGPEKPYFTQILGYDPFSCAQAAKIIEKELTPLAIDLNFACPDKNVVSSGSGGAITKDPDLAARIIKEVKNAVKLPVSVKTRVGFSEDICYESWIKSLEVAGADIITIHGRTVKSAFAGEANWSYIKTAKDILSIPVIGSGSILDWQDIKKQFDEYSPDAIMVGRAALGHPWIFEEYRSQAEIEKSPEEIFKLVLKLATSYESIWGNHGIKEARKHFAWYVRGFQGASELRNQLVHAESLSDVKSILKFKP